MELIEGLRPFGKGNPSPLFAVKNVNVNRMWLMGKDKNFLKLRCEIHGKSLSIDGISFDKFLDFKEEYTKKFGESEFLKACDSSYINIKMDIIYYPNINEFNGKRNIQLMIKNLRIV